MSAPEVSASGTYHRESRRPSTNIQSPATTNRSPRASGAGWASENSLGIATVAKPAPSRATVSFG